MTPPYQLSKSSGLQWRGRTDRGRVRPNNEDAFMGLQFDARECHHLGALGEGSTGHADYVFAVSDGLGGANAGQYASRIAVEKITTLLPRCYLQTAAGLDAGFPDVFQELFAEVHEALVYLGASDAECAGMEATLSLCWFTPGRMYFGHIGDSRIYYLGSRTGTLKQLTHDDTHVGWLFRQGKISEREAREHPRRHALQKALGGKNQFVEPQIGAVTYEAGDLFLLCTDGLVDGFFHAQLEERLRSLDWAADRNSAAQLTDEAVARSGRDNTTALIVRIV